MNDHQIQTLLGRAMKALDQANHCFGLIKMAIRGEEVSLDNVEISSLDDYIQAIAKKIGKKLGVHESLLLVDPDHCSDTTPVQQDLIDFDTHERIKEGQSFETASEDATKFVKECIKVGDVEEMPPADLVIKSEDLGKSPATRKMIPQEMSDQEIDDFRDDWNSRWPVGSRFILIGTKLDFVTKALAYRYDKDVVVPVHGGHHFDVYYLDPFEEVGGKSKVKSMKDENENSDLTLHTSDLEPTAQQICDQWNEKWPVGTFLQWAESKARIIEPAYKDIISGGTYVKLLLNGAMHYVDINYLKSIEEDAYKSPFQVCRNTMCGQRQVEKDSCALDAMTYGSCLDKMLQRRDQ